MVFALIVTDKAARREILLYGDTRHTFKIDQISLVTKCEMKHSVRQPQGLRGSGELVNHKPSIVPFTSSPKPGLYHLELSAAQRLCCINTALKGKHMSPSSDLHPGPDSFILSQFALVPGVK